MREFILKYFDLIRTIIAILIGITISIFVIYIISKAPADSIKYMLIRPIYVKREVR